MKKHKKKIIIALVSIVIVAVAAVTQLIISGVFSAMVIGGLFSPTSSLKKAEKAFSKDNESLIIISDYFQNSNYESIHIPLYSIKSGIMYISGEEVEIEDKAVVDAISKLKLKGYNVIGRDGNTIHFQRWSKLDCGSGIAYSINGSEPVLNFITTLEGLSKDNWYYYVEDFNEWRNLYGQKNEAES